MNYLKTSQARKFGSIVLSMLLIVNTIATAITVPVLAVEDEIEKKISVDITGETNTEKNIETINIVGTATMDNVKITNILLPNQEMVYESEAQFIAEENADYTFTVFYEQPTEPTEPTEPVEPTEPTEPTEPVEPTEPIEQTEQPQQTEPQQTELNNVIPMTLGLEGKEEDTNTITKYTEEFVYSVVALVDSETEIAEAVTVDETEITDAVTADEWFLFNPKTQTITGYSASTNAPKSIVIPTKIGGADVLHIGQNAFSGQQLTGLVIPEGIKTIGNEAFANNLQITGELKIPNSVTYLGNYAFWGCTGLTSLTVGDGITSINGEVFSGCKNIESATFGKGITTVGYSVVANFVILKSLTFLGNVSTIDNGAFYTKEGIEEINIPEKMSGSIEGAPWSAKNKKVVVYWKDVVKTDVFAG